MKGNLVAGGGGSCPRCGGFIAPGDVVAPTRRGAAHPECVPSRRWLLPLACALAVAGGTALAWGLL